MRAAYAQGTQGNLITQWKTYIMFCLFYNLTFLPASDSVICYYAQFLSRSFKAVSSIRNYISGVKKLHSFLNVEFPDTSFALGLTLRGLERIKLHCPKQASPISPEILIDIFNCLDVQRPVDAVIWCLFLIAFFTLARKSNLVAGHNNQPSRQIRRGDVYFDNDRLVVNFKWTKTIQCGERALQIPVVPIPNSVLCPVTAYSNMVQLVPASSLDPVFCFPTTRGPRPVFYQDFMLALRALIAATGRDPTLFSSHSFRREGATFAFHSNVPGELIQVQGDWLSNAYLKYLDLTAEKRLKVSQKMRDQILRDCP